MIDHEAIAISIATWNLLPAAQRRTMRDGTRLVLVNGKWRVVEFLKVGAEERSTQGSMSQ